MQQELTRQKRYRSLLKVLKYVRHSRKRLYTRTSFIKQIKSTKVFYMYKKKSWVIKSWFMKKYRWKNKSSSNSNDWTPRDYKTYIKKDLGGYSNTEKKNISTLSSFKNKDNRFNNPISNLKRGSVTKTYRRKKVLLNSYLSGTIQKMPRFYSYKRFGKEKLTKYKTLPFKLSMSRFLANKIFRNFYSYIGKKKLLRVHKKVETKKSVLKGNLNISSIKRLKKLFIQPLNKNKNDLGLISKKIESSRNLGQKYEKANLIRIKKKWIQKSQGEKSKSFITLLEQRLDSSILRLFHFKPNLMKHSLTRRSPSINKDNDKGYTIRKKPKKKIRSNPLTSFTPAQIKQMISHGKIFINGKKVKSGNRQINILDKIEVKGFIQNLNHKKKIFSTLPKEGFEANPVHKRKKPNVLKNKNLWFNRQAEFKKDCLSLIKKSENWHKKKDGLALPDLLKKIDRFSPNHFGSISSNFKNKNSNAIKSQVVGSRDFSNKNSCFKTLGEDNHCDLFVFNHKNIVLKQNHQRTLLLKNFKNQEYLKEIKEKSLDLQPPSGTTESDSNLIKSSSKLVENKLKTSSDGDSEEIHICDFLRALKLKRFTETFYTTYRNLHLFDRKVYKVLEKTPNQKKNLQKGRDTQKQGSNFSDLSFNKEEPLEKLIQTFLEPKIEEETKFFFDRLGSDQSIYNLWSLSPLLKVNKWNPSLKKGLSHSVFKREKIHNLRLRRKLRWLKKRGYFAGKFVKFIRNYYKTKSKVVRFIVMKDKWQKDNKRKNKESEEDNDNSEKESTYNNKTTVPQHIIFLSKKHPSWINYIVSRRTRPISMDSGRKISVNPLSNIGKEKTDKSQNLITKNSKDTRPICYASLIYGTRSSHSVRWQQFNKNARTRLFYNRILKGGRAGGSDKFNFFELELEFVQSIYESYSGYTRS